MNEADRIIDATARRQHGAFNREQALAAGLTPRMIDHRRASGAWLTLARSVYALSSHPFTWLRQAKAAELSVPGAAVSHGAAAFLHGIPGARAGGLDLTMPPGRHGTSRIATVHRCRTLETTTRQGIAVTSLPRTVVALAGLHPGARLEVMVDEILAAGLAGVDELHLAVELADGGHPRGLGELRRILAERSTGYVPPTSRLE